MNSRCLFAIVLVAALGCGAADRADVSGTVTIDGKPIEEGSINFFPTDGTMGPTVGGSIKDGKYALDPRNGIKAGSYQVKIQANRKTGKKVPNAAEPGTMRDEVVDAIPPEYGDKSKVKAVLKPGPNTHDVDVLTK